MKKATTGFGAIALDSDSDEEGSDQEDNIKAWRSARPRSPRWQSAPRKRVDFILGDFVQCLRVPSECS